MPSTLPLNSTLRSVTPLLEDKASFIPAAFAVIHRLNREHGDVVLRLGVKGTGKRPNYRIEDALTGLVIEVIDGNSHKQWTGIDVVNVNWSDSVMSYSEVRALLADLRQSQKPGA